MAAARCSVRLSDTDPDAWRYAQELAERFPQSFELDIVAIEVAAP
jgi:hypothetical protein